MKNLFLETAISSLLFLFGNCTSPAQTVVDIDGNAIISEGYIGNGAQWDPYQLDYGHGHMTISDADWQKMYNYLDFMRPQFIRVMMNTTSVMKNGKLDTSERFDNISGILNYCQSRGVSVMFGDWGWGMVNAADNIIDTENLQAAARYVAFLKKEKGYSCIKYYNIVNEPNGYWSSTDGSFSLWAQAVNYMYKEFQQMDLLDSLAIVGPDVAIWDTSEVWWMDSCATGLKEQIGLYDIHTYPSKITVNSGEYSEMIKAYKNPIPKDKKIVMGEIGFKYIEPADSLLSKENLRRASSKKYASVDDSQMFVYDHVYGTDMVDALFQTVNAGFSGSVAWMMDDAMHGKESPDKLKIWGFWNIFGDEFFGAEEEVVRPWFYAWSLITRYMPAGSTVYKVKISGDSQVKAIAVEKDQKYMLALVNVDKTSRKVLLKSCTLPILKNVKRFVYQENNLRKANFGLSPEIENMVLDLSKGQRLSMGGETLLVYTNFDY